MGSNGIFQLKQPSLLPDGGPAEIDRSFNAHILHLTNIHNFLDIHPHELMRLIFHPQPQGADFSRRAAHGDHVHRAHILLHTFHHLLFLL